MKSINTAECIGSGMYVSLMNESIREILDLREHGRGFAACPECSKTCIGEIIRGPRGLRWILVPDHTRKRTVIVAVPKEEYL